MKDKNNILHVFIIIVVLHFLLSPAHTVVQPVSQSSQTEVDITLYPQDVALIKEQRKIFLKEGSNKLLIKDVPSQIFEDSFIIQMQPPSASIKIQEYNFQTSDMTRKALLDHSIGENVRILPSSLVPMPKEAKLLSLDGDECIVESSGQIFVVNKNRIAFSRLPYTLVPEPLITLKVNNSKEGEYVFNMGYLTKGFHWDAGYTIVLDATDTHFDLDNWINIRNNSGMDIKKGHFLVAHAEEDFYDIEKPITLSDNAVKNISWFSALSLTPSTSFRIIPKNKIRENEEGLIMKPVVETWLTVQNDADHGIGVPLPQGTIKVFRRNTSGSLSYVGENSTPFIAVGKVLSLRVGSTQAIKAEMHQTDFRKLGNKVVESGYRLDLKNATAFSQKVTVFQEVAGEWNILRETHPHEKDEKRLEWILTLKPQEEISLRYRIRMN